ncbi:hypothetical protein CC78DRAFT_533001 [Lojkania enalia]|uniref:Uncharacterized protein n=1 Tax=Lojkania enalia TaxID=147567 RepID=A0A9P4N3N1_9PLEO|nr:hypothetical protein CC78DRAFT_533001 [Didymosphaeria enalia]
MIGLWLRDLQTSLPGENVYVGTDIVESYFPPKSRWPSNFTLQIQSITKKWPKAFEESFDLVHQRFALPAAGKDGVRDALHGLVSLVKPGGWIQFVEADHSIFTGPAMGELFKLVEEVFGAMNVGHDHAKDVKGMLEEEGLEVVEERIVDVPLGAKNPSPDMGRKSAIAFAMGADGIVGAARRTSNELLLWYETERVLDTSTCTFSQERLDSLMSRIERELKEEGGIHRLYIVWGRRPFA